MRASKLLMVVGLGVWLAACATVPNPVTSIDIYRIENVYATSLELIVGWRKYCWDRTYKSLMLDPVGKVACENRRAKLRRIQTARVIAGDSVRYAKNWVQNNPTVNANSVLDAAWKAVNTLQNTIPRTQ